MTRKSPFSLLAQEGQPGLTPQPASPRPPSTLGLLEVEERGLDTDLGFNPGGHGSGCPSTRFNTSWASLPTCETRAVRICSQRRGRLKTLPRIKSLQPPYRLGPEEALGPGKLKVTPGLGHSPPAPCPPARGSPSLLKVCPSPAWRRDHSALCNHTHNCTHLSSQLLGSLHTLHGHTAAQGQGTATQTLHELNVDPMS